ncbi:hypothetical protein FQN54_006085 [Arachnomyces sp. PD_36]|nr:hypothetical protein FQN54_006085 [Arachnomyces sp. PD_36]
MASNIPPNSEPVVDQPTETSQDPSQTTNLDPSTMNDSPTPSGQPTSQPPPTQPPSDEPTKEILPEAADKESSQLPATSTEDPHPTLSHSESLEPKFSTAIGPSSEQPDLPSKECDEVGPSLVITLLLTTGARHPFKIDGKYLRKRSVNVDNNDPFSMSVYTLKELIWREWRPEWETRPASPTSIRLISFGKLLDDKAPLSDSKLNPDAPNVLHMTVKPQEIVEEEDAKGTKASYGREPEITERSPRCRCVML